MLLAGCAPPKVTQALIQVSIQVDGTTQSANLNAGSTVSQALAAAGVSLGALDRVAPPDYTVLSSGSAIKVTRVSESFDISEVVVPFERQTLRNETLPEGEELLVQPGANGLQEITYRKLSEDGVEVSRTQFKTSLVKAPVPEIVMVGVQAPFAPVAIPGKLAYLVGGNAWLMDGSTGTRRPLVASGDLDGRIFALSPSADWLLFTRKPAADANPGGDINRLWVVKTAEESPGVAAKPIDLKVKNVIHYAGWVPGQMQTLAYSTVEPRPTAPGWQANNDLQLLTFSASGFTRKKELLGANSGGIYGWWGTTFAFSWDGKQVAYARPDGIGLVDLEKGRQVPLLAITPLQTLSDWAWVPGLSWSDDGRVLYTVTHPERQGTVTAESSQEFDLTALLLDSGQAVSLEKLTGMFAYPVPSSTGRAGYQVAYLRAGEPQRSQTSRYALMLEDQDGSNTRQLFPENGQAGLEPQQVVWDPTGSAWIAFIYQGNIWLADANGGAPRQVTGDGLAARLDW